MPNGPARIILFDGVCNLCNGLVRFIIKRDKKSAFTFGSLQSENARVILSRSGLKPEYFTSVVYFEGDKVFVRSTAILRMLKELGWAWKVFYIFILLPVPVRDFFYDFIAKNRYKIFGRSDQCMVPTPELKSRFLD